MHAQWQITDASEMETLRQACNAINRAESCRKIIDAQGEMINVRGQYRSHPLLSIGSEWGPLIGVQ